MPVGTRALAAPTSIVISAAPLDGDAHVGRGAPQRAVRRLDDRPVGAGPGRTERGQATHGEGEERETRRVEEYAARETRHTVTTIGSSQPPGKFAYWDSVSHVVTACDTEDRHAIAARCHYRARPRRRGGVHPNHADCARRPRSPLRRRPEHGGDAGCSARASPEARPVPDLDTRRPARPSAAAEVPLLRGDRG